MPSTMPRRSCPLTTGGSMPRPPYRHGRIWWRFWRWAYRWVSCGASGSHHIELVQGIVRQAVPGHGVEARVLQHLGRALASPARAEPRASSCERDRHAVREGQRVEERPERVFAVLLQMAARGHLLHQEDTVLRYGPSNPLEHRGRLGLVVNGVERDHEVRAKTMRQMCGVMHLEPNVVEPQRIGPGLPRGHCLPGDVHAEEPAIRIRARQRDQGPAPPTPDIDDLDPLLEASRQLGHER